MNISESILSFIQQKDISHVKLQGNYEGKVLQSKKSVHRSSVSFKTITDVIFKHFDKNIEEAKTLMDKINSNKQERTVTKLRLGVNKEDRKSNSRNLNKIINETPETDQNAEVPEHMRYLYTNIEN